MFSNNLELTKQPESLKVNVQKSMKLYMERMCRGFQTYNEHQSVSGARATFPFGKTGLLINLFKAKISHWVN